MNVPEILISYLRGLGRYFALIALLLQIIGTWGCHFVIKYPYDLSATEHNHEIETDPGCAAFDNSGIALSGADVTYNFAKWMSYLATTFGIAAAISDCTILRTCPCKAARTRFVQNLVMASLQLLICVMLGLKFTLINSSFCTAEWLDTNGEPLPNDSGDGSYKCTLAWGGVCVAVAVALWAAAGGMTLGKAFSDKAAEEKKEQNQADAMARKTIARGSAEKEREAAEAASMEMVEGI
mmetsp:Transcript_38358/g.84208  ORF Transcript_38358/g.84208 Transcript_38358/m.84208 type:complete len:238 (-) Transcript_38358:142-855(-)